MPYLSFFLGKGGGGCIILIFSRVACIVVDTRPPAEVNWLSFVVILRIVSWKWELCAWKEGEKKITEAGLKWAHMINMAVLLKWNVANGDGEGGWWWVGGVGQDGGMLPWLLRAWACLDGTAHPLPLCLCSCVTHCLPACNFPSTVDLGTSPPRELLK